jgi:hypothetical protein
MFVSYRIEGQGDKRYRSLICKRYFYVNNEFKLGYISTSRNNVCSFFICSVIKPLLLAGHVGLREILHFRPMTVTGTTLSVGLAY